MTVWFCLDEVDFAVTGERIKGYTPVLDRFEVKGVRVRGPSQDIANMLDKGFAKRLAAAALQTAQHPIAFPYDLPTPRPVAEGGQS